jgi:hypothetical protein
MERRSFLATGVLTVATLASTALFGRRTFAATRHRYKLAPELVLPADIRRAPDDVREAYRFAIAIGILFVTFRVTVVVSRRAHEQCLLLHQG